MICSTDLFKHVSNFQVLENDLTVHFPIQCSMLLSTCSNVVLNHSSNVIEWEQYRWKSIHAENFKSNFSELFDIFKLQINLSQNTQVVQFLSDFVNLYKLSAEDMLVKSKPFSNAQPAWWDYDCQEARTNKILALRKFRLMHSNYDLVTYKSMRNQFKGLCKLKKARTRNKKRTELFNCRNDAK